MIKYEAINTQFLDRRLLNKEYCDNKVLIRFKKSEKCLINTVACIS